MRNLIFFIGFYLLSINHIFSEDVISNCDLVASDPFDLQNSLIIEEKIEGTLTQDLINEDYTVLVDACKADLNKTTKNKVRYSYQLARIYYAFEEYELSEPLFDFAYNEGYIASSFYLGSMNFHDFIGNFDKTSIKYFNEAYEGGYAEYISLSYLADSYYWLKDYVNAEKYYLIFLKNHLEDQDHSDSNFLTDIYSNLADIYYQRDMYVEAEIYFKETVSRYRKYPNLESKDNYLYALDSLGYINFEGLGGLPVDYNNSHEYFVELLNSDNDRKYKTLYTRLYLMYRYGLGVDQDYEKAFEYTEMGIQWDKSVEHYINHWQAYFYGDGVEKDLEKAKMLIEAITNLKIGDVDNTEEDLRYYQREAQNNLDNWDYMVELSKMEYSDYDDNICHWMTAYKNMVANHTYSFQKCLEIAISGNQTAMEIIAQLYEEGEIVKENFDEAYEWYIKLNNLYPNELSYLYEKARLRLNGNVQKDINLTKLYLQIINNFDHSSDDIYLLIDTTYSLAQTHRYGITTKVDFDKSIKYFEKVINLEKEYLQESYAASQASQEISEIKSIKSGFLVEKNLKNYFPSEFKGKFNWERNEYNQVFESIKFEELERLGVNNYLLIAEGVNEDGTTVKFKGELNISDMSFKLSYDYTDFDIPASLQEWDLRGNYLGFFNDDFSKAEAWYSKGPGLGSRGIFKLINKNKIENIGSKSYENNVEKLNINFGNYYALIIGNQNYDNMTDLNTAIIDAESIASLLKNKYKFEILEIIIDGERSEILSKLNEIKNKLQPYDNLLVYYAGHGHLDTAGRGYWLPKDSNTIESDDNTNWISNDDITNLLSKIKAKHILVIADSCFSGSLTFRGSSNESNREKLFANLVTQKTRKAFTSGTLEPVLDGGGQGHSIFASKLLELLSQNKKILDVSSLFIEVKKAVSSVVKQTPTYGPIRGTGDEGGDFIFVPVY